MKEQWDTLIGDIQDFKELLEELLEMVPQSAKFHQKTNAINKVWKRLQKGVNNVDQFISPVKSVKVSCPLLDDQEFKKSWQFWKDYLNEQHGIVMRSRAELMQLKRLMDISKGDPKEGIKTLEFIMSRPTDKNIYKVKETELAPEPADKTNGKTVIKLPANYLRMPTAAPSGGVVPEKLKQKSIEEEIKEFKKGRKSKKNL